MIQQRGIEEIYLSEKITVSFPVFPVAETQLPLKHPPRNVLPHAPVIVNAVRAEHARPHEFDPFLAGDFGKPIRVLGNSPPPP